MLKKKLKKKLSEKGFTLAELLIVVAIIAVLAAVSIPVFSSQLEKAKRSTDLANIKAAKSAAVTYYLNLDDQDSQFPTTGNPLVLRYDAVQGKLVSSSTAVAAYGKSNSVVDGASNEPKGKFLQASINKDGDVTLSWVSAQ